MLDVAVLGATGAVGQVLLQLLEERQFPVHRLRVLASSRSAGTTVTFAGREIPVEEARPESFAGVDIAFFAAGNAASQAFAREAVQRGAVVIDKGSLFRQAPDVPLAVPEVNPEAIRRHRGLIASPNCSTIQLVQALKPLHQAAGLRRVVVSTYQAVSGTGKEAAEELLQQTPAALAAGAGRRAGEGAIASEVYWGKPMAFNVLPQCDSFGEQGYTLEEWKLVHETRKILALPTLPVAATAVRVPVFTGHSESVLVETERKLTAAEAREALSQQPGVVVVDDPSSQLYPTALEAAGRDETFVGRIREDLSSDHGLHLWVVSDNLRKGAATNAIQIAEFLVREGYFAGAR